MAVSTSPFLLAFAGLNSSDAFQRHVARALDSPLVALLESNAPTTQKMEAAS
jgi:hypothetical protein